MDPSAPTQNEKALLASVHACFDEHAALKLALAEEVKKRELAQEKQQLAEEKQRLAEEKQQLAEERLAKVEKTIAKLEKLQGDEGVGPVENVLLTLHVSLGNETKLEEWARTGRWMDV